MTEQPSVTVKQCVEIIKRPDWNNKKKIASLRWLFKHEKNFETFCRFFFSQAFSSAFAEHHHEIIKEFNSPGNSSVAAPRGSGKSTVVGTGWNMWLIVNGFEKYIVYTSENHRKSTEFISPIRTHCKTNKLLRFVYPELDRTKRVVDQEGKDREDCFDVNDMRVEALSFDKDIRGLRYGVYRPTLIIFDDIENRERTMNPELRVKDEHKLNSDIIPALDPEKGRYKMVGTILHVDSLLKKKLATHGGKIYRAIKTDGTLLWPQVYTQKKLDEIKKEIGSLSFAQEYLNDPAQSGTSIFKREWLERARDEDLSMFEPDRTKYEFKVQGVDFAFADRITADSSVFAGLGKFFLIDTAGDVQRHYDVCQLIWKQGMSITEQFDYIEYLSGTSHYHDNALEENSIVSMSKELRNYKFNYTLFYTAGKDAAAKEPGKVEGEYAMKRHVVGKPGLITRMATIFENGDNLISLPYKTDEDKRLTNKFIEECMTFAFDDGKLVETGIHADAPIAVAYAIERAEMEKFRAAWGVLDLHGGSAEEEEEALDYVTN